jgi:GTP-binding protein HflX
MITELNKRRKIVELRIPQSEYAIVSEVMRLGNVLNQDFEENDVLLKVDIPAMLANKLAKYVKPS